MYVCTYFIACRSHYTKCVVNYVSVPYCSVAIVIHKDRFALRQPFAFFRFLLPPYSFSLFLPYLLFYHFYILIYIFLNNKNRTKIEHYPIGKGGHPIYKRLSRLPGHPDILHQCPYPPSIVSHALRPPSAPPLVGQHYIL